VLKLVEFYINYKPTSFDSLNWICSRKHWGDRNKYADAIRLKTINTLKRHRIPRKPFENPVRISIAYPKDGLDLDNHGFFAKAVIDGMKGWVIEDDAKAYFKEFFQEFYDGDLIRVMVEEVRHEQDEDRVF